MALTLNTVFSLSLSLSVFILCSLFVWRPCIHLNNNYINEVQCVSNDDLIYRYFVNELTANVIGVKHFDTNVANECQIHFNLIRFGEKVLKGRKIRENTEETIRSRILDLRVTLRMTKVVIIVGICFALGQNSWKECQIARRHIHWSNLF